MIMRRILVLTSSLVMAIILLGCNTSGSLRMENKGITIRKDAKRPAIGLTLMTYNNPFFIVLKDAAKKTAEERGSTLIEHNAENDSAKQIAAVEDFITRGVEAILLNPVDSSAIVTAVESANNKGIPVICIDVKANGGKLATFVASDNEKLGIMTGEYLVKRLGGKGKIAIVGHPTVSSGAMRVKGLKSVLTHHPDIKIVSEQSSLGDRVKAMEVAENILTAHPDVDAVWAVNDPSALGCVAAIESAGLRDKVFVVGIDGSPEATEMIRKSKVFAATAAQYPQEIGKVGVEMALKAIDGDSFPEFLPTKVSLVTVENVDSFPGWK
jgi:ribose transport system substrate-binding protein